MDWLYTCEQHALQVMVVFNTFRDAPMVPLTNWLYVFVYWSILQTETGDVHKLPPGSPQKFARYQIRSRTGRPSGSDRSWL